MTNNRTQQLNAIGRLLDILDELRLKCPWDKKQTFASLKNLTIEEVYELADSIETKDNLEIKKELGDVLMHVFFYAKIASETDIFDLEDVANSISDKLIFRHPHIYGDAQVNSEQQVLENWEKLKLKEGNKGVLAGVPRALPALIKAFRMQQKAAGVGFTWASSGQAWDKVEEELIEFKQAQTTGSKQQIEEEFGDVLFAMINYGRIMGIDAEDALNKTNMKFIRRFEFIESKAAQNAQSIADLTIEEMLSFWVEAKEK